MFVFKILEFCIILVWRPFYPFLWPFYHLKPFLNINWKKTEFSAAGYVHFYLRPETIRWLECIVCSFFLLFWLTVHCILRAALLISTSKCDIMFSYRWLLNTLSGSRLYSSKTVDRRVNKYQKISHLLQFQYGNPPKHIYWHILKEIIIIFK